MKISIILATFNGEKYFPEQLESLLGQTRLPDELIIGDDASDDRTATIALRFADSSPFVTKVIENSERLGYKHNFSKLATQASGDILVFCDQDDVWEPNKLQVIERYLSENPKVMCAIHDIKLTGANSNLNIPSYFSYLHQSQCSTNIFIKGCATAIRKELAKSIFPLPMNSAWAHDDILHVVATISGTRGTIKQILINHRIHKHNTSGYIAPRMTLWRRIDLTLERWMITKISPDQYHLMVPRHCSEGDLMFLYNAAASVSKRPAQEFQKKCSYIQSLADFKNARLLTRDLPIIQGLRVIRKEQKRGTYRKLGGKRLIAFEYFLVFFHAMLPHQNK